MSKRVKISVAVITYNQQNTIGQTLDSILCQKGDFDLEVVVGEDCSTDGTYAICQDYAMRYPRQMVLLENMHNLGIMANFARVVKACTGEYVGICAGDDYWCDKYKLQKQLNYFLANPEVGVVSTAGYKLLVKTNQLVPNAIAPISPIKDGNIKPFYFSSAYRGGVYAMPLSLLINRELIRYIDFDEFVRRGFPVEDYPMQAILAQHTKWGHISDLCVVYRVYKESATFISFDHPKYLQYYQGLADIRRYLNDLFPNDMSFTEEQLQENVCYKEYLLYLHNGDYQKAKRLLNECVVHTKKINRTRQITKNRLIFNLFRWYKLMVLKSDLKKRT